MTVTPLDPTPSAWTSAAGHRRPRASAALVDLDPDLGSLLDGDRLQRARAEVLARELVIARGLWAGGALVGTSQRHLGLLLLHGAIAREVVLEDTVSMELIAPGDVIRPWAAARGPDLLQHRVRWQVLAEARLAVLDHAVAVGLARYPEISASIVDRIAAQTARTATIKAIAQLNAVERRLVALFWHLAESWGRVVPDGVIIPLALSHRQLGELIGARRPTVSTALSSLQRAGRVHRRSDGTWLIGGEPPGRSDAAYERVIPHRRRLTGERPSPRAEHDDFHRRRSGPEL